MAAAVVGLDVRRQMQDAAHLETRLNIADYAASIGRRAGAVQRVEKLEVAGFLPDAPAGWVRRYFTLNDADHMLRGAPEGLGAMVAEFAAAVDTPAAQTVLNYSDGLRVINVRIGPASRAAADADLTEVSPQDGWAGGYRAYVARLSPELELVVLGNASRAAVMQFWRGVDRGALQRAAASPQPQFSPEEELALTPMPILPEAMIIARAEYEAARVLDAIRAQQPSNAPKPVQTARAAQVAQVAQAGPKAAAIVINRFAQQSCRAVGAMMRCAATTR